MNVYLEFDYDDTCLSIEEEPEKSVFIDEGECESIDILVVDE